MQQAVAASMREMGKNHNSVLVFRVRLKFWWRILMGVKNNHTKYEQGTREMAKKFPILGQFGFLGCPLGGPIALEPT